MNYTKGKWRVIKPTHEYCHPFIVSEEHNDICTIYSNNLFDAQLISAAPDMYEALKELRVWAVKTNQIIPDDLIIKIGKAISKAEGK